MTDAERDALVGRVIRESKEAEKQLNELLVRMEQLQKDFQSIAQSIQSRIQNVRSGGTIVLVDRGGMREVEAKDQPLDIQEKLWHDRDELRNLDSELTAIAQRVKTLRRQRHELDV